MDALNQVEILINLFLQSLGLWLAAPMQLLSMLGKEEFYLLLMPALYWCFNAALGIRVAVIFLLSNAFCGALKIAFHLPRPYWLDAGVKGLAAETSFGLPSGHASNGIAVWGMLATGTRSRWIQAALYALVFLIGLSRVYLGVHFTSDVLAGWLLGGALLWGFFRLEAPVVRWVRALSLEGKLLAALLSALGVGALILVAAAVSSAWKMPDAWAQNALAAVPGNAIQPFSLDGAFTIAGTWFGMLAGVAWLFHRQGGLWNAAGSARQRVLRFVVGAAGVLVLWNVLGMLFPRNPDVISYSLRFARYTLIGLWVSALAPLLFQRMGLAYAPKQKVSDAPAAA